MDSGYRYDGSTEGLLTLLARLLEGGVEPQRIVCGAADQQELFGEQSVASDPAQAAAFWERLRGYLPPEALRAVRLVLAADRPGRELLLYRYLRLAFVEGGAATARLGDPRVAPVWQLAGQVGREVHRYLGFVRFQQVQDGLYYAAIEPEHRILALIAAHFSDRFRDQPWLIHDRRHQQGLLFDPAVREYQLLPLELLHEPDTSAAEQQFQALWRCYFQTLGIAERKNLKLQQSKVPLKVRPWLSEFS